MSKSYQHILITGGCGFVGSNLSLGLRRRYPNTKITAFDNFYRKGSELNERPLTDAGITVRRGDVRSLEDLEHVGMFDLLIECAAEPSVIASIASGPRYVIETNLVGALNCFEVARKHHAHVLFISTSRVYPHDGLNALPFSETDSRFVMDGVGTSESFPLEGLRTLYGATKLSAELILKEYAAEFGMRYIVNRCGVLAGPGQFGKTDQGVVALWVARHLWGDSLSYIGFGGTGKQVRDILHIDDYLDAVLAQLQRFDDFSGRTFNIGGGTQNSVSLKELTGLCATVTGRTIPIASDSGTRPGDVRIYITDNSAMTAATGWTPRLGPRWIVSDTASWMRSHRDDVKPILIA